MPPDSGSSRRPSLVCLGSGAALNDGRLYNSLLIGGEILLDLPPTAVPQLHRLGQDLTAINHIFISHLHGDHAFGLPFLLLDYCVRIKREEPLYIIGPSGLEGMTDILCDLAWPEMRQHGFEPHVPLRYVEVEEEGTYSAGDLEFIAIPMKHFTLDAYGYRFEHRGTTYGYTGDTGECTQIHRLLDGVDVAIMELTHPGEDTSGGHLDKEAVSRLTKRLRCQGATVVATHMSADPGPIEGLLLCEDGQQVLPEND